MDFRAFRQAALLALAATLPPACSESAAPDSAKLATGSAGDGTSGSQATSAGSSGAGSGGTALAGGASTGGATSVMGGANAVSGGSSSGTAGMVSSSTGGTGGSAGSANAVPSSGPFECTLVLGSLLTSEWWNAGFETDVSNAAKWELKWHHHGNIKHYADVASPFWSNEGDPNNDAEGSPIVSPCSSASLTPDRILFFAIDWDYLSEQEWVDGLQQVIDNIKLKYPSAKRIDLMNEVRCPNNQMCNPGAKYGPGADADGLLQDCYVQPYVDTALQKVIARAPELLALGPQPESAECNPAHNGAHLTTPANTQAAQDIAKFYASDL